jgi:outer membrane protein assembly factor BamB
MAFKIRANSPSVTKDRVFLTSFDGDCNFLTLDAETGKEIWRLETGYKREYKTSAPVIVDGILYVASGSYLHVIK